MKYVPSVIAAVLAVLGVAGGPISAYVGAHPQATLILGGLYAILSHLLPSPLTQPSGK